jgi:hypothetical protein
MKNLFNMKHISKNLILLIALLSVASCNNLKKNELAINDVKASKYISSTGNTPGIEGFYNWQIKEWWAVGFTFAYITNVSGGEYPNAFVPGLHMQIEL